MKTMWKKTLLAALPLAGLLLTAPAAFAHDHHHHRWENRQHCRPDYGRGWRNRWRHDDNYRPGWYGGRRYDDNYRSGWYSGRRYNDRDDYYRSRYPQQSYDSPWWQSYFYR